MIEAEAVVRDVCRYDLVPQILAENDGRFDAAGVHLGWHDIHLDARLVEQEDANSPAGSNVS